MDTMDVPHPFVSDDCTGIGLGTQAAALSPLHLCGSLDHIYCCYWLLHFGIDVTDFYAVPIDDRHQSQTTKNCHFRNCFGRAFVWDSRGLVAATSSNADASGPPPRANEIGECLPSQSRKHLV